MSGKIFVNYRRDDSAPHALSITQYLENVFGKGSVFIDIDRLRAGQKFPAVLEDKLGNCGVMLAVVGPGWLSAQDEKTGARRLDNPEDWVRLEIERALARGVPVIPVLVGGAQLPDRAELPLPLQPLVDHQCAVVTTNGFRHEMAGLSRDISDLMGPRRRWPYAAALGALAIAVAIALPWLGVPMPWTGSDPSHQASPQQSAAVREGSDPEAPDKKRGEEEKARAAESKRQADLAASADAKRAAEEKRKAEEAERQRLAMLAAEEDKKRREAEEAARKAAAVPKPGETFRDCPACPEVVVVPAGEFKMGSPANEEGRSDDESPQRTVKIAKPFAVGKYEVTFAEWDACVAEGGCKQKPETDWDRGRKPVIYVSWDDAKQYVGWLSDKTGKSYRLLDEAEWEFAARAGTTTKYAFGDTITTSDAQFSASKSAEVGSFKPNAFGLYDMHGNVWEWVEDCYQDSYKGAPTDGSAVTTGACIRRVLRGGSWDVNPGSLRSAVRYGVTAGGRNSDLGFRVGRTLTP